MPPITITNADQINDDLGSDAILGGYTQIPIYTYVEQTVEDDINYNGCPNLEDCNNYYYDGVGYHDAWDKATEAYFPVLQDPID